MIVNIEFLDEDPIENAITSMNYDIDKTIFVGFYEMLNERKASLSRFLRKYCSVKEIQYVSVPHSDFEGIMEIMRRVVEKEQEQGNKVFFDITGGDSITLVAFGIIARELDCPLHIYKVESNQLIELEDRPDNITKLVAKTAFEMTLDKYIELHGGIINYRMQKEYKNIEGSEEKKDIKTIWNLSRNHTGQWNQFSMFLAFLTAGFPGLNVALESHEVIEANQSKHFFKKLQQFNNLLDQCAKYGILSNVEHSENGYRYTFKNELVKDCLIEAGSILELYTYLQETTEKEVTDCRVGVHIDWDGIIHNTAGYDVLNEIDVLYLEGNTPTFISCKNGNVDAKALYELETVADRFGGKYAKRKLVVAKQISNSHYERAKEMNIEICNFGS